MGTQKLSIDVSEWTQDLNWATAQKTKKFLMENFIFCAMNVYKVSIMTPKKTYEMLCVIWYNLHNLKNVKNTHGEELLLLK